MTRELIIAGFGGQGVMAMGKTLIEAGLKEGYNVSWVPSYGPEMRGGTAHCTVVISDEPIGSPMVRHPSAVIALNLPSLDKYEGLVKPGGVLVYNSSLVERAVCRSDIRLVPVPANDISLEETAAVLDGKPGDARLANVTALGALLQATGVLPLEAVKAALAAHLPERHRRWLEPNGRALRRGAAVAEAALA